MKNKPVLVPYEVQVSQFLAVFRFFAFAAAVGLILLIPPETAEGGYSYLLTGMVGTYTLVRLFYRLPIWSTGPLGEVIMWGDMVASLAVVLVTGGLNSGFLLYSLVPVTTAALRRERWVALSFASLSSASLIVAHLGLSLFTPAYAWVLSGRYLSLLVLYTAVCVLVVLVGSYTNLNLRRRLEEDTIAMERGRLRRELHDHLAQSLAFLQMKTGQMQDWAPGDERVQASMKEVASLVEESYQEVRSSLELLSAPREGFSLLSVLPSYVQEWSRRSGIQAHFTASPSHLSLSPTVQWELLHIVREALANIQKHSGAHIAGVELKGDSQGVSLAVRDNGRGFSASQGKGHGLGILEERTKEIGGTLNISSAPGQGTEITVTVPQGK